LKNKNYIHFLKMNCDTGREFDFTNPQDDPHLYAPPPTGFAYSYDGTLVAAPMTSRSMGSWIGSRQYSILFLQNPGIGNGEWLEIHEKFLDVIAHYKDCDIKIYSAGPPCGGYYYRVDYQDQTIIEQLEKIGLKASDYAEQLITEGTLKRVFPKTKSNEIF
jgi:hypothetical protein